jgi:hypothetical protein
MEILLFVVYFNEYEERHLRFMILKISYHSTIFFRVEQIFFTGLNLEHKELGTVEVFGLFVMVHRDKYSFFTVCITVK